MSRPCILEVRDNDDHDDRLGEYESAMDLDTNDEANETIDKAEDDNERELTDPLRHTESSEIHDQLEVDEGEALTKLVNQSKPGRIHSIQKIPNPHCL